MNISTMVKDWHAGSKMGIWEVQPTRTLRLIARKVVGFKTCFMSSTIEIIEILVLSTWATALYKTSVVLNGTLVNPYILALSRLKSVKFEVFNIWDHEVSKYIPYHSKYPHVTPKSETPFPTSVAKILSNPSEIIQFVRHDVQLWAASSRNIGQNVACLKLWFVIMLQSYKNTSLKPVNEIWTMYLIICYFNIMKN